MRTRSPRIVTTACISKACRCRQSSSAVMPLAAQPFRQTAAGAPIDEKFHDSATDLPAEPGASAQAGTADRVSLAIIACA